MSISRIDLVNRHLPRTFRGYDIAETDRLLQDLSDALGKASDEKVALTARVAELENKLMEHRRREGAMQQALVASQRMGEQLRAAAQKEAQLILEKAHTKAEGFLHNAHVRLARTMEELAEAKKGKALFEAQLRNVIRDHLCLLDLNRQESTSLEAAQAKLAPVFPGSEKTGA